MFNKTKIYSVYVKRDAESPLESAVLVKQGFNFWAFFFMPFWALYNRMWILFAVLMAISVFFTMNDSELMGVISLLFNIWFGCEANNFRSSALERKGYLLFDVVVGIDEVAAQQRFFDKYLFGRTPKQGSFNITRPAIS